MENTEIILEKIRAFADRAHGTQMRKYTPERYIVHPVRVMEMARKFDDRLTILAAALLHDVIEDTEVDYAEMLKFMTELMTDSDARPTLQLVEELTDVYVKSTFPQWNRKLRKEKELERISTTSADSQTIKYADIIDNTREIPMHDPGFAGRYLRECRAILERADKGNPELRGLALERVRNNIKKLKSGS